MDKIDVSYFENLDWTSRCELSKRYIEINDKSKHLAKNYWWMSMDYKCLAIIQAYYFKNIKFAKIFFYQAYLFYKWCMENYKDYSDVIEKESVTTYQYGNMFYALLSGDVRYGIEAANLFGMYPELEKDDHKVTKMIGYSLKYTILDDKENALKHLDEIENRKDKKGMKRLATSFALALRGIVERNEEMMNEGLQNMFKTHVSQMKSEGRGLETYFAYEAMAVAILAKSRDLNIKVSHRLFCKEYLVDSPEDTIDFDNISIWTQEYYLKSYNPATKALYKRSKLIDSKASGEENPVFGELIQIYTDETKKYSTEKWHTFFASKDFLLALFDDDFCDKLIVFLNEIYEKEIKDQTNLDLIPEAFIKELFAAYGYKPMHPHNNVVLNIHRELFYFYDKLPQKWKKKKGKQLFLNEGYYLRSESNHLYSEICIASLLEKYQNPKTKDCNTFYPYGYLDRVVYKVTENSSFNAVDCFFVELVRFAIENGLVPQWIVEELNLTEKVENAMKPEVAGDSVKWEIYR